MEMPKSGYLGRSARLLNGRGGRWVAAAAGIALALSLVTGCKSLLPTQQTAARTDQQITGDIQAKIQGETALAGQNIQVSVSNGVATLSGTVTDDASRALAGNDSGTVSGVKTVVNNLTVQSAQRTAAPHSPAKEPREEMRHQRSRREESRLTAPQPQPIPNQMASAPATPSQPVAPPPTPSVQPRPITKQLTLDAGTVVPVIMTETLDSKTAQPNDVFHATLANDLMSGGVVVIPRGAPVLGRVVDVKEAAHFKGNSLLTVELTQLNARGRKITLVTDPFSKQGAGRGKNTAEKSGGGAALGAIVGALAGGGKGAAIGALAGGGAGAGVNAVTRGQQVQIPSESRVEFRLQSPITVTVTIPPSGQMQDDQNSEPQLQQR